VSDIMCISDMSDAHLLVKIELTNGY
jgi:hypothetical protein